MNAFALHPITIDPINQSSTQYSFPIADELQSSQQQKSITSSPLLTSKQNNFVNGIQIQNKSSSNQKELNMFTQATKPLIFKDQSSFIPKMEESSTASSEINQLQFRMQQQQHQLLLQQQQQYSLQFHNLQIKQEFFDKQQQQNLLLQQQQQQHMNPFFLPSINGAISNPFYLQQQQLTLQQQQQQIFQQQLLLKQLQEQQKSFMMEEQQQKLKFQIQLNNQHQHLLLQSQNQQQLESIEKQIIPKYLINEPHNIQKKIKKKDMQFQNPRVTINAVGMRASEETKNLPKNIGCTLGKYLRMRFPDDEYIQKECKLTRISDFQDLWRNFPKSREYRLESLKFLKGPFMRYISQNTRMKHKRIVVKYLGIILKGCIDPQSFMNFKHAYQQQSASFSNFSKADKTSQNSSQKDESGQNLDIEDKETNITNEVQKLRNSQDQIYFFSLSFFFLFMKYLSLFFN